MTLHPRSRDPLRQIIHHRKPSNENLDRFIPNRAAMDFDFANYMLTKGRKGEEDDQVPISDYRKQLAELLNMNRTRILSFKSKPFVAESPFPCPIPVVNNDQQVKPRKPRRSIPQAPEKVLDAPDILDDFYLNLLDWGSSNVLAIGLADTLYLWDASTQAVSVLMTVDPESGPITSVSWAGDGRHVAVGLSNSEVELWDTATNHKLRTFRRGHSSRVGCLAWNNHILTTGGMDGQVINNDVRSADHFMNTYQGHRLEVCGLKWSSSGQQLASGGGDNLLHIWDQSMASNTRIQWLHRLEDHTATVKALAWCPFQSNMIASGGGIGDHCIKFWNTHTGACLNSVDTGSQVCSILWNKNERELLSAHGFSDNQLSLWKYPSMVKIAELKAHTSRVLFMTQSPDGCTVATAAADETLRLWNVFGTPQGAAKRASNTYSEPFANVNRIR